MLSHSPVLINTSFKSDNYQSNSILSTSSEQYPCQTLSLQITPLLKDYPKKIKKLPICYSCDAEDCTMLFNDKEEAEKHKTIHQNLINCNYPGCNKKFIQLINLKKHYKYHFPSKKIHFCPFPGCHKSFTASYNLTIHYRIHKGDRPYECEKCGKKFFDRANYKYHFTVKHIEIKLKDRTCQHKGCCHKSKTIKQKLMHHDKLEIECKTEKNHLFNLLNNFQYSLKEILELKRETLGELNEFEENNELKEDLLNIQKQAKILFDVSLDKDQFKGIISNY